MCSLTFSNKGLREKAIPFVFLFLNAMSFVIQMIRRCLLGRKRMHTMQSVDFIYNYVHSFQINIRGHRYFKSSNYIYDKKIFVFFLAKVLSLSLPDVSSYFQKSLCFVMYVIRHNAKIGIKIANYGQKLVT